MNLFSVQRKSSLIAQSQGILLLGLLNSVFNFPDRQVKFFREFQLQT